MLRSLFNVTIDDLFFKDLSATKGSSNKVPLNENDLQIYSQLDEIQKTLDMANKTVSNIRNSLAYILEKKRLQSNSLSLLIRKKVLPFAKTKGNPQTSITPKF